MTRDEAIREACEIVNIAYQSVGNFSTASDCFCGDAFNSLPAKFKPMAKGLPYCNDGKALAYVRVAVLEKLKRDGHSIKGIKEEVKP